METAELVRPGCKDQYKHNTSVLDHFEAAAYHLREAEVKEALAEIVEGKKLVLTRQK